MSDVDRLAALIRSVDGSHSLGAAALAEALIARGVRLPADSPDEVVHSVPPVGFGLMSCCGKTPFELPTTHRMTADAKLVTCGVTSTPQPDPLIVLCADCAETGACKRPNDCPVTSIPEAATEQRRLNDPCMSCGRSRDEAAPTGCLHKANHRSGLQRATEHDWFGRREPEGHVTFCRICGGRFENVRFVNCPGRATEQQQ